MREHIITVWLIGVIQTILSAPAGGMMCYWRRMEPLIQLLSTIKPSVRSQAGLCSAWPGWMAPSKQLLLQAMPLCCTALHRALPQLAEYPSTLSVVLL